MHAHVQLEIALFREGSSNRYLPRRYTDLFFAPGTELMIYLLVAKPFVHFYFSLAMLTDGLTSYIYFFTLGHILPDGKGDTIYLAAYFSVLFSFIVSVELKG